MRILHVMSYFHPATRYGGPVPAVLNLARGQAQLGHEVEVCTTDADGPGRLALPQGRFDDSLGVRVVYHRRLGRGSYFFAPMLLPQLAGAVRRADVVHVHGLWTYSVLAASRLARILRRSYVLSPHGCLAAWALAHHAQRKRL